MWPPGSSFDHQLSCPVDAKRMASKNVNLQTTGYVGQSNTSHLWNKRRIIFKSVLERNMLVPSRVIAVSTYVLWKESAEWRSMEQECATCRDVHMHILKPALHFPSHSCSNTAAKLLLFRGPCWQRIDVYQLELNGIPKPGASSMWCANSVTYNSLTCKFLMTWTESQRAQKKACTCTQNISARACSSCLRTCEEARNRSDIEHNHFIHLSIPTSSSICTDWGRLQVKSGADWCGDIHTRGLMLES